MSSSSGASRYQEIDESIKPCRLFRRRTTDGRRSPDAETGNLLLSNPHVFFAMVIRIYTCIMRETTLFFLFFFLFPLHHISLNRHRNKKNLIRNNKPLLAKMQSLIWTINMTIQRSSKYWNGCNDYLTSGWPGFSIWPKNTFSSSNKKSGV